MVRFPRIMASVLAMVFAVASVASAAKAQDAPAPNPEQSAEAKTLHDAYPDVPKTIEFNGEMKHLIGFDTKSGEAIYGSKQSIQNMLKGISKGGPTVKTLLSYPSLPKAIQDEVGTAACPECDDPGDGGSCDDPYTWEGYDDRTYGKPGTTVSYYYAQPVWWTVDCREGGEVIAQESSADYSVTCGTGSASSSETTLSSYSRRSRGNYTFNLTCLPMSFTRWVTGTTSGYSITWVSSQSEEEL